ncbi:hypothetical protein ARMGADRAFT_686173 [Armillaria gallica]|uniref:Uncharacterized protein n=1 Tax=Armillaria gallica TaxID=47427 RepID=A0A2H3D3B8_ARMGA|nr:hypothetical protein ARMGADRAFT_686173 [Armillaria gallica]
MASFFQDCGPASDPSNPSTNGEQCVINSPKLIGVIVGVVAGLALISAIMTCLRRRRSRDEPGTQFILAPAPPPTHDIMQISVVRY